MKKAGQKYSLYLEETVVTKSVHRSLNCVDCHENFDGESSPHAKPIVPVDCFSCHEDTGKKHAFHRRIGATPIPVGEDTNCTTCHGTHAVTSVKTSVFAVAGGGQIQACGRCHIPEQQHFSDSAHGVAFAANKLSAPDCLMCHRDSSVVAEPDKPTLAQKIAQMKQCESCHVEEPSVAGQALRGLKFVSSFDHSVHGTALAGGNVDAANCVDCHGAHEMNRAMVADARVNKLHVADTCANCHEKAAREFGESVHVTALHRGNLESAACTDCHGEHDIRANQDPTSPVNEKNVAQQVCANCHASLRLTEKYGLPSNSLQSFEDSYHGLAARGGSLTVVNCASCHSSHGIKSQQDPTSTIHPTNLAQTCGQCHPRANTRFAVGKVHVSPEAPQGSDGNNPVLYLVSSIYVGLIVITVGGMGVHNALDLFRKVRRKLAIQKGLIQEESVAHRLYLRMTAQERCQHAVLVLSFVLLVITGFMLRYPEAWWVSAIRNVSARTFEWRGWIHRVAGVALVVSGAWHASYLAFTPSGRALWRDLLPRKRDLTDPLAVLKYNLGWSLTKPAFPRFSYIEKVEYWAMLWGSVLMTVTGFLLWFDNSTIGLFTKLGFDISRTVHFYEAVLATLSILVWHFYFVIFNPDIYPMNLAWLTGRMSEREMLEEHPLELARLKSLTAAEPSPSPEPKTEGSFPVKPDEPVS
jgi:cytochrome b subunit of formate dehydrogenase